MPADDTYVSRNLRTPAEKREMKNTSGSLVRRKAGHDFTDATAGNIKALCDNAYRIIAEKSVE